MAREDILVHADSEGRDPAFVVSDGNDPVLLSSTGVYSLGGRVIRELFTTPGSCLTSPLEGSVMAGIVGGHQDPTTIRAAVSRAVVEVSDRIRRSQLASGAPSSELLSRLEVVSIENPTPDSLKVRILVVSVSGEELLTTVGV